MGNGERRWSELCARKALGRYLRSNGCLTSWSRGDEPPDWWVDIKGERFAVEVTRAYGYVMPAGSSGVESYPEHWAFFLKLRREIDLLVRNIPDSGRHFLHMQPMIISSADRKKLLVRVKQYVLEHISDIQALPAVLLQKKGQWPAMLTLEKKSPNGAGVLGSFSRRSVPISGSEIEQELQQIVMSALVSKALCLDHISEPKILVIVDTYGLAQESFWAALRIDTVGPFAAVFRANSRGFAQLLFGTSSVV